MRKILVVAVAIVAFAAAGPPVFAQEPAPAFKDFKASPQPAQLTAMDLVLPMRAVYHPKPGFMAVQRLKTAEKSAGQKKEDSERKRKDGERRQALLPRYPLLL